MKNGLSVVMVVMIGLLSACQQARPPRAATGVEVDKIGGRVSFDSGKSKLSAAGHTYVAERAKLLKEHPQVSVILEGHTDARGSESYNLSLGDRRARQVKWELVQEGVDPGRVVIVSYGETRPVEKTRAASASNRRVEIVVK